MRFRIASDRGLMEFSNGFLWLEKQVISTHWIILHGNERQQSYLKTFFVYFDLIAVLVFCFVDIETGEKGCDKEPHLQK
jgi:hypothetical protein